MLVEFSVITLEIHKRNLIVAFDFIITNTKFWYENTTKFQQVGQYLLGELRYLDPKSKNSLKPR